VEAGHQSQPEGAGLWRVKWEDLNLSVIWDESITGKTPLTAIEGNFGGHSFVTPSDMDGKEEPSARPHATFTEIGADQLEAQRFPRVPLWFSCIGFRNGERRYRCRDLHHQSAN